MDVQKYLEIQDTSLEVNLENSKQITAQQLRDLLGFGVKYLELEQNNTKNEVKKLWKIFSSVKKTSLLKFYIHGLCQNILEYISHLKKDISIDATQYRTEKNRYLDLKIEKNTFSLQSLQEYIIWIDQDYWKKEKITMKEMEKFMDFTYVILFDMSNRLDRWPLRAENL